MRKGEIAIIAVIVVGVVVWGGYKLIGLSNRAETDTRIPYYSTATPEVQSVAAKLIHQHECKNCHFLWGTRVLTQAVPAPALDGEGSFRSEEWLYEYFSADDPQTILPTRLKPEYRHPKLAHLEEVDRKTLAAYMYSLKVEDWYREETVKSRYEKLTGKDYENAPQ